uniref:COBRA C-terminal domain-containing protein n=1 Tax=Oryza brachyantha TaxID=4533 RepID=J3LZZ8_ORYBR
MDATRSRIDKHRHVQALRKAFPFLSGSRVLSSGGSERFLPRSPCSDMAGHLHIVAVQGGLVADVLRLPLVALQQNDRAVCALQLRLPTVPHGAAVHPEKPPDRLSCRLNPVLPHSFLESDKPELSGGDGEAVAPFVRCTNHMCPVRVHWHVKIGYREYWRLKVTITN